LGTGFQNFLLNQNSGANNGADIGILDLGVNTGALHQDLGSYNGANFGELNSDRIPNTGANFDLDVGAKFELLDQFPLREEITQNGFNTIEDLIKFESESSSEEMLRSGTGFEDSLLPEGLALEPALMDENEGSEDQEDQDSLYEKEYENSLLSDENLNPLDHLVPELEPISDYNTNDYYEDEINPNPEFYDYQPIHTVPFPTLKDQESPNLLEKIPGILGEKSLFHQIPVENILNSLPSSLELDPSSLVVGDIALGYTENSAPGYPETRGEPLNLNTQEHDNRPNSIQTNGEDISSEPTLEFASPTLSSGIDILDFDSTGPEEGGLFTDYLKLSQTNQSTEISFDTFDQDPRHPKLVVEDTPDVVEDYTDLVGPVVVDSPDSVEPVVVDTPDTVEPVVVDIPDTVEPVFQDTLDTVEPTIRPDTIQIINDNQIHQKLHNLKIQVEQAKERLNRRKVVKRVRVRPGEENKERKRGEPVKIMINEIKKKPVLVNDGSEISIPIIIEGKTVRKLERQKLKSKAYQDVLNNKAEATEATVLPEEAVVVFPAELDTPSSDDDVQTETAVVDISPKGTDVDEASEGADVDVASKGADVSVIAEETDVDVVSEGTDVDVVSEGTDVDVVSKGTDVYLASEGPDHNVASEGPDVDVDELHDENIVDVVTDISNPSRTVQNFNVVS